MSAQPEMRVVESLHDDPVEQIKQLFDDSEDTAKKLYLELINAAAQALSCEKKAKVTVEFHVLPPKAQVGAPMPRYVSIVPEVKVKVPELGLPSVFRFVTREGLLQRSTEIQEGLFGDE